MIGKRQVPSEILKKELENWSKKEAERNEKYKNATGKLTENDGSTTAFPKYIQLLSSIGLIRRTGNILSLTKQGKFVFNVFKDDQNNKHLHLFEKIIYLDLFLRYDADIIICIYNILYGSKNPMNQKAVQKQFKSFLVDRLSSKLKYSTTHTKSKVAERKRVIQVQWEKPESYAEHFVAPRLEWMSDLGIVEKINSGSNTTYQMTVQGTNFFNSFNRNIDFIDFTNEWYLNNFFRKSSILFEMDLKESSFNKCQLGKLLMLSSNFVESSGSFKLPVRETLFYVSLSMLILHKTIIESSELIAMLEEDIIHDNQVFGIKSSARINEGYITNKIK
ncbi:MAG: hypothetical protein OXH57_02625 [Ekhidna sp.]|nr:hypothetical protein [Ekhidna sp.]